MNDTESNGGAMARSKSKQQTKRHIFALKRKMKAERKMIRGIEASKA